METNLAQGVNGVEVEKLRVGQQAGGNLGIKWWRPSSGRGKEEQWLVGSEAQRLGILLQSLVRGDSGLLRTSPEGRTAEAQDLHLAGIRQMPGQQGCTPSIH